VLLFLFLLLNELVVGGHAGMVLILDELIVVILDFRHILFDLFHSALRIESWVLDFSGRPMTRCATVAASYRLLAFWLRCICTFCHG
jgi:hypothetical protein